MIFSIVVHRLSTTLSDFIEPICIVNIIDASVIAESHHKHYRRNWSRKYCRAMLIKAVTAAWGPELLVFALGVVMGNRHTVNRACPMVSDCLIFSKW